MNVTRSFGVLILLTIMSLGAEGWMRVIPKRGDPLYPGDAELAEYLSYLRDGYDQDPAGAWLWRTISSIINLIFRIRDETKARTLWKQICGQQVCRNNK